MANNNVKLYVDYSSAPVILREFLHYSQYIKIQSPRTIRGYFIDLQMFFRFLIQKRNNSVNNDTINEVDISGVDLDFISKVSKSDIYDYIYFISQKRNNSAASVARKLSSIKSYFKYLTIKTNALEFNPAENIEQPSLKKRMPKYLSLEQSLALLNNLQTDFTERDYCMLIFFLSCGMRLSELVGIDINDINDDTLRVIGKGNKERFLYLNNSCIIALNEYLNVRNSIVSPTSEPALFISKRTKRRLTGRRVEQIVKECLKTCGIDEKGFSAHKLRHTAATQLYRYGGADVLALKELLGHEHVSTTEIYTHISDEDIKKVAKSSPLAHVKKNK